MSKLHKLIKITKDLVATGMEHHADANKDIALLFERTPDDHIARETFENHAAKVSAAVLRRKLERTIMLLENI